MNPAIEKKVQAAVEAFHRTLEEIENAEQVKVKELEKQIVQYQQAEKDLKAQGEDNNKRLQSELERLEAEKQKSVNLQKELQAEISKYQGLQNSVSKDMKDATKQLEDAKIERSLASETLQRAKDKERDYQQKTKALEADFVKADEKDKAVKERQRLVEGREKVCAKREEELAEKESDYQTRIEDVAKREKSVGLREKNVGKSEK